MKRTSKLIATAVITAALLAAPACGGGKTACQCPGPQNNPACGGC